MNRTTTQLQIGDSQGDAINTVSVIVHRGTHQIGGCCVEITTDTTKILVDFGMNLPGTGSSQLNVNGVTNGCGKKCDAIFITHYHGDHIGELGEVAADIPIYMGNVAIELQKAYQAHLGEHFMPNINCDRLLPLFDARKITLGDIAVTPILSDHSAFQSFMFLIEAVGKRILHTGDFRLHGENASNLIDKLAGIGHIDLLISEGTTLSRKDTAYKTEDDVKAEYKAIVKKYKYSFLLASSSNIERLESFAAAIPRGKYLLADGFQKEVFGIIQRHDSTRKYHFAKTCTPGENLAYKKRGFGWIIRANAKSIDTLIQWLEKNPDDTRLVYSMWSGYKAMPGIGEICRIAKDHTDFVHSSGHVVFDDLNTLINKLRPERIVFIHTDATTADIPIDLSHNVLQIEDGEVIIL